MSLFANIIAFQLGWLACVLGAAWGWPWAGAAIALAIIGWHLTRTVQPRRELTLILAAAAIGALWDSLLPALGWIEFPNGMLIERTAPYWMVALWMLFATTLNVSLAWLKPRLLVGALFGAVGGPLAYFGGAKLGGLVFNDQTAALTTLAIGWALLTPLLLLLARRYDGFAQPINLRLAPETSHG
ncbi:MAG: DUF2878 domain-containing protein [Pseudomonadota bacterium]|nr:MAG: DUF2878 domain-containing protein [Pseudomonadota bacterium]